MFYLDSAGFAGFMKADNEDSGNALKSLIRATLAEAGHIALRRNCHEINDSREGKDSQNIKGDAERLRIPRVASFRNVLSRLRPANNFCPLRSANPFANSEQQKAGTKEHSDGVLCIYRSCNNHCASDAQ
jgi:hypothetical protein